MYEAIEQVDLTQGSVTTNIQPKKEKKKAKKDRKKVPYGFYQRRGGE